jgi:hypothetical protein
MAQQRRSRACARWKQPSQTAASAFLDDWIARARLAGVRQPNSFAKTLQRHREGILAYYDVPISTGPLEGTNNKIKTRQRQAYKFRSTFVPSEGHVMCLFEAASPELVRELNDTAGIPYTRVIEAMDLTP